LGARSALEFDHGRACRVPLGRGDLVIASPTARAHSR
jgi:hypothetical protein